MSPRSAARAVTRASALALATVAAVAASGPAGTPAARAETVAIRGATVHVEPGTVLDDATVIIADGRIQRVARDAAVPAGVRVVDGRGKVVTAGFVEAATTLGLIEVAMEASTRSGRLTSRGPEHGDDVIHAGYRVSDGYNATAVGIPIARAQGVTSAIPAPSGGLVSGTTAWFSLADGLVTDVTVKDPLALYANLGEAGMDSARGSRGMALMRLRELLDDARAYDRARRGYERNQARPFAAERLDLEAVVPVARGVVPLVVRANRSSDILAAVGLATELGLRLVILGGTESWMVAETLAARKVPVILDPSDNLPSRFESIHVRDDAAKILATAGVPVILSSIGGPHAAGTLRQLAGIAVAHGMTPAQALAAVTTAPADAFGVARGRLEAGAVADLVVWSGDPFELATRAEAVFIAGAEQSLRTRHSELLQRYRRLGR